MNKNEIRQAIASLRQNLQTLFDQQPHPDQLKRLLKEVSEFESVVDECASASDLATCLKIPPTYHALTSLRRVGVFPEQVMIEPDDDATPILAEILETSQSLINWIAGPTDTLIKEALEIDEDDEDSNPWNPLSILHWRATPETLAAAQKLCKSTNPEERELGVDILGQLGVPIRLYPEECFTTLIDLWQNDADPNVLSAVGIALGHLHDARAIPHLIQKKDHGWSEVRYGVVYGLAGYEDESAVATMIELMDDADSVQVRNWATFALASLIEADSPTIRDALYNRLTDPHFVIRGEALVGLAVRQDDRIVDALIDEMTFVHDDGFDTGLVLEAVEEVMHPALLPYLEDVRDDWDENDRGFLYGNLLSIISRLK